MESKEPKTDCYVFAAGGTGGHIIPALAVASALRELRPEARIVFIGGGSSLESQLISPHFQLQVIRFVPVLGKGMRGLLTMLLRFPTALAEAMKLYRQCKPQVVIAFGGYPSFVPSVAALCKGIPRILHEQNAKVGLANKVLALFSTKIFAVRGARGFIARTPEAYLSNPVRQEFFSLSDWAPPTTGQPLKVLVIGGSQGAQTLNNAVVEIAPRLEEEGVEWIHVAGARNEAEVVEAHRKAGTKSVQVYGFVDRPWELIAQAHLVISRAGAMAAAELVASARPALYVPLVIAAAHQAQNIEEQVTAGAALTITQDEHLAQNLREALRGFRERPQSLNQMAEAMRCLRDSSSANAAKFIAEQAVALAKC